MSKETYSCSVEAQTHLFKCAALTTRDTLVTIVGQSIHYGYTSVLP